ncbi:MAG: hypothetical protein ABI863_06100 [Ginsengibacter sp.]
MKKYILILLFVVFGCASGVNAQDPVDTRAEKIQSLKIAFITQKLQLTSDEAEKFWPIYNQYDNEIHSLPKGGDVITTDQKLLDIRKKYAPSFDKVIGPQKLNKLFNAERDFRDILIRRLQNRQQQRMGPLRR